MAVSPVVVEDGTIVPGANSYVSVAELDQFISDRGYTWAGADKEAFLYRSMDWIESRQYQGNVVSSAQPLLFPRTGVCYRGFLLPSDEIPALLKKAQLTLAIEINRGFDPLAVIEQGVKRQKLDVLEVEFQDGTSTFSIRSVNAILRPLFAGGISSAQRVL